jgi:UDP-N-acetylmuramate dehydrogenase
VTAVSAVDQAAAVLGARAERGRSIGALTTYRVGGPAALVVVARSLVDLRDVAEAHHLSGLPVLVVGRGSNLLVADSGFAGIAVVLDADAFGGLDIEGNVVRAGAALPLPALARRTVEAGLAGLEWAVGVPGSVGGGVRMNAGGHGSDMAERILGCRVVDLGTGPTAAGAPTAPGAPTAAGAPTGPGAVVALGPSELALGYRRSSIRPEQVVVDVDFGLEPGDRDHGLATIREIVRWRREHQPGGQNAGSVFTNPPPGAAGDADGRPAGWLIETAGAKGLRIGTAAVSDKHANFIQADPGGSADDVRRVMQEVAERVRQRWGVTLHTEIRLIGFPEPSTSSGGPL